MPARDATIHGSDPINAARMHTATTLPEPTCIAPHSTAHRLFPTLKKGQHSRSECGGFAFALDLDLAVTRTGPNKTAKSALPFSTAGPATAKAPRLNPGESMR
jgi:hypothetical protein